MSTLTDIKTISLTKSLELSRPASRKKATIVLYFKEALEEKDFKCEDQK